MSTSSARPHLGIPRVLTEQPSVVPRDGAAERRLSEVVARDFELVWRTLRRFGVPEGAADDATQHVLLTFAARMTEIEVPRERAFLMSTALRVAANERRRLERAREVPLDDHARALVADATPEGLLEEKRRRLVLDEALATLPLDQRAVFVLFELEGFTLPEIAESLGIPLGTATSRLRRARDRFEAWVCSQDRSGESP
jgi:RNA polymerase sigma-70 factor, ECF subfamily